MIDVFIDEVDLGDVGFGGVDLKATGRPPYHPGVLPNAEWFASTAPGANRDQSVAQTIQSCPSAPGPLVQRRGAVHVPETLLEKSKFTGTDRGG